MARQSFSPANIELRYKTYYAVLYVPKDVRHIIGKTKFSQSTRTGDRHKAEQRAAAIVLAWKTQISRARVVAPDPIISEAQELLAIRKRYDTVHGLVEDAIDERAAEISQTISPHLASDFKSIALGIKTALADRITEWRKYQETKGLRPKTLDQQEKDIKLLSEFFTVLEDIEPARAQAWIEAIAETNNLTASSVIRITGSCKSFYKYLQTTRAVSPTAPNPFNVPEEFRRSKKANARASNRIQSWIGFEPDDVVLLYGAALTRQDTDLANLIKIGAYTGARIEEICSLKCSDVNINKKFIKIKDAKTEAGNRTIPIHSEIENLLASLKANSADNYIISGLTFSKYNNRSNAIGKRFGRMKLAMGFDNQHVFHSIRKTFITLLENSGAAENLAADIVGHEKPRITYGLYSAGSSLKVMSDALEKVAYNFPKSD
ncbi:tyrosine-type recombinase/integrase [Aquabacterium sp.]|uniref:tyrosine-type recombinase/integrase n=1 Tax=Aquabacterium sp. TaxID=1872578 RepID=UPI00403826A7